MLDKAEGGSTIFENVLINWVSTNFRDNDSQLLEWNVRRYAESALGFARPSIQAHHKFSIYECVLV